MNTAMPNSSFDRTSDSFARHLAIVLSWLTEEQLTTQARSLALKSTSKHEQERHVEVSKKAVANCIHIGIEPRGLRGAPCPLLVKHMRAFDASLTGSKAPASGEPFKGKNLDLVSRQMAVSIAWLVEVQLATLEGLECVKKTSKTELKRQRDLCDRAVSQCVDLGITAASLQGQGCGRLQERLLVSECLSGIQEKTTL